MMAFQPNADERVQNRVLEEAQRHDVEPQRLFDKMMDTLLSENLIEKHVTVDERGVARTTGHRIKVAHIAVESEMNGLSPSAIARSYQLSLAQVHAALAYYYDHLEEMNAQIGASRLKAERLRNEAGDLPSSRECARKAGFRERCDLQG